MQGLFAVSRITPQSLVSELTPAQQAGRVGNTSFADELSAKITQTVGRLEQAESLSIQGIRGEVETREVVDAVMSAEQSLQAAISIRDKIVQAYLEMSRMQI
jgi:flagellar hook-basal body complex protein FliE